MAPSAPQHAAARALSAPLVLLVLLTSLVIVLLLAVDAHLVLYLFL